MSKKKKNPNIMFKDYDRCTKHGREILCNNCSSVQQNKCKRKEGEK